MRQGQHQKRGRGRGNNRRPSTPNRNQTFDSNGPDVRIRGNANQVHEKYLNLARDATTSGDRVLAESYYQHAEHYFRIMSAFNEERAEEQRRNGGATGEQPNVQVREWSDAAEADGGERDGQRRPRDETRDADSRGVRPDGRRARSVDGGAAERGPRERDERRSAGRSETDGLAQLSEGVSTAEEAPAAEATPARADVAVETEVADAPAEPVSEQTAEPEEDGIRRTLKLSGGGDASERKPPRRRRAPAPAAVEEEVSPPATPSNDDDDGAAAAS